jgi:hypothetical protein
MGDTKNAINIQSILMELIKKEIEENLSKLRIK